MLSMLTSGFLHTLGACLALLALYVVFNAAALFVLIMRDFGPWLCQYARFRRELRRVRCNMREEKRGRRCQPRPR